MQRDDGVDVSRSERFVNDTYMYEGGHVQSLAGFAQNNVTVNKLTSRGDDDAVEVKR